MKKIVSDIHNAEQNSRKTIEFLTQNSSRTWFGNYPIAVVNEITSIKDEESLKNLQTINFFNSEGFSKNSYTQQEIEYLTNNVPSAIKTAYCLCLKEKHSGDYSFEEKSKDDHWKNVTDENNFVALVESSKFNDSHTKKVIENSLREIIQGAKDIPSLKTIGFAWIVTLPKTTKIEEILEHYFLDNHIFIEKGRKITYIAWADTLADINIREFAKIPRS